MINNDTSGRYLAQDDHDLIVELRTEFRAVRADIKELKDTTAARLTVVETDKLNRRELQAHILEDDASHSRALAVTNDHEVRIRWLERSLYIGFGIVIILQTALSIFGSQIAELL